MALRDVINNLFRRNTHSMDTTSAPPPRAEGSAVDVYQQFAAERERERIIKTCREMYKVDPRVEKAHRVYAKDIVRGGFFVKTENAEAKAVADALQKRLNLNQALEDAVRLSARDGDSFYEVVVNDAMQIETLSRKPTLKMHRNSNAMDQFDDPRRAFWLDPRGYSTSDVPQDAVWFSDWQMIHARWNHDEENRYGTPMFSSATSAFKRSQQGELNVAVRRQLGGSQLRFHVVEGSPADVETYKEQNKAVFGKVNAVTDLFSNKKGSLEVHQGDGTIDKIDDVRHHIATMMTASDIPMELIAYGGDLNRDILGEKKEEYEETQRQTREWVTNEIVTPLLERQWLLMGILPENVDYRIIWRTAKSLTPESLLSLGNALARLRVLGVKEDVIQTIAAMYVRDVDEELMSGDGLDTAAFAQSLQGISV